MSSQATIEISGPRGVVNLTIRSILRTDLDVTIVRIEDEHTERHAELTVTDIFGKAKAL
jgi:hypothetical protein